jgi:cell division transport system permease protein
VNRIFASAPERRLIPSSGLRGPVPLLIAIMTFVMVIVAAAGLALANSAAVIRAGVESHYSIQIADGAASAPAAIAAARSTPGVTRVEQVPPEELRRTLERWLGPAATEADLPVPAIIDVDLRPGADPRQVAAGVARAAPGARFVAHRTSLAPLLGALQGLTSLAFTLVLLIALASAAAIVLAALGALDTHRATIEVMHGIGATDRQIARLFLRQIAIDALIGGLMGAAVAGLVIAAIIKGSGMATLISGAPLLGWSDAWLLGMAPLLIALMASTVARAALLRALRGRL